MKVVILQSNYVPWKGYFDLINDADVFVFYDEVQYTKNDWRNRNVIYTKNGLQWLTIPVVEKPLHKKISDVKIASDWCQLHYNSLYLGYKSAPFFFQLEELMQDYLIDRKWETLKSLNQYLIKKISTEIGISTSFVDSKDFELKGDRIEKLIGILTQLNATKYITGPSASGYLKNSMHLFAEYNIQVKIKNYDNYLPYQQLKQPFENQVSILDMLANVEYSKIKNHIWER